MKRAFRRTEPSAVALIEEAVHLVRRAPIASLARYYLGSIPFVASLLFFWAYLTWFQPPGAVLAWAALGMSGLFVVMKVAHAAFCSELLALRMGRRAPAWSWGRMRQVVWAQLCFQPWALIATACAVVLGVPFGWVYAYAQIGTVSVDEESLHASAIKQAQLWPAQNHQALALLLVVALCTWCNVAAAFTIVPWLANRLLGIDNLFGLTGWWVLNTTVLVSVTAVTWLVVDPVVKAFYTLWVFYGRSRRTGEDLRVEFAGDSRVTKLAGAATVVALLLVVGPTRLPAAVAASAPAPTVAPTQLDRAIDEVLAGSDFAWRLRPIPGAPTKSEAGPVGEFLRQAGKTAGHMFRTVARAIGRVADWIAERFSPDRDTARASTSGMATLGTVLIYALIALAVGLLLWLLWIVLRQMRGRMAPVVAAEAVAAAAPDLRDDNVHAAQLPTDGWLALARVEAAKGEWRLALRALYLATLARLAGEGLISLAKFKTNLDYERELRRRVLSRTEVVHGFVRRRRTFEDVWYGYGTPMETDVREWLAEFERAPSR